MENETIKNCPFNKVKCSWMSCESADSGSMERNGNLVKKEFVPPCHKK